MKAIAAPIRAHILDIVVVDALSLLLLLAIFVIPWAPLRIGLGLPFVLLFPGYTLTSALHPRRTDIALVERLMLTLALSIALAVVVGLFINFTPWGLRVIPIVVGLSLLIFPLSGIALYRRLGIVPQERFQLPIPRLHFPASRLDLALYVGIGLAILALLGGLVYQVRSPNPQEMFSQFYILGSQGKAEDYPSLVPVGKPAEVTAVIVNQERRPMDYIIRATLEGEPVLEVGPISLAQGGKCEGKLTIVPTRVGDGQKLEFVLSSESKRKPAPPLYIWLNVVP